MALFERPPEGLRTLKVIGEGFAESIDGIYIVICNMQCRHVVQVAY
jgi:hypothetical protein